MTQLSHGSPALPPDGTRPEAMPPTTAPRQYGTSTDETAKAAPKLRRSRVRNTALRNAKLGAAEHDAERGERQRDEHGRA